MMSPSAVMVELHMRLQGDSHVAVWRIRLKSILKESDGQRATLDSVLVLHLRYVSLCIT